MPKTRSRYGVSKQMVGTSCDGCRRVVGRAGGSILDHRCLRYLGWLTIFVGDLRRRVGRGYWSVNAIFVIGRGRAGDADATTVLCVFQHALRGRRRHIDQFKVSKL